jgi:hypothetical protein
MLEAEVIGAGPVLGVDRVEHHGPCRVVEAQCRRREPRAAGPHAAQDAATGAPRGSGDEVGSEGNGHREDRKPHACGSARRRGPIATLR